MNASSDPCPFCQLSNRPSPLRSEYCFTFLDAFPVSQGHTLVIPHRHVGDLFDLSQCELADVFTLVTHVKGELQARFSPDGFNIGVNVGPAAGQTIMHAHVHVIPRYAGDSDDPTGGVRNVISGMGRYGE